MILEISTYVFDGLQILAKAMFVILCIHILVYYIIALFSFEITGKELVPKDGVSVSEVLLQIEDAERKGNSGHAEETCVLLRCTISHFGAKDISLL